MPGMSGFATGHPEQEENVFASQAPEPAWTPPAPSQAPPQMGGGNDTPGVHHVLSSSGTISNSMWTDSAHNVAAHLTQNAAGANDADNSHCGAAALLGGAVMNGQAATAAFIENAAGDARTDTGDHHGLQPATQAALREIAAHVRAGTATFEELNRVQEVLYTSSRDRESAFESPGLTDHNVAALAGRAEPGASAGQFGTGADQNMDTMVASLQPGQSAVMRVLGSSGSTENDHFITIGRQPDGTPYIYNPDPSSPDHDRALVTGQTPHGHNRGVTPQFEQALQHYMNRTDAGQSQEVITTPAPTPAAPAVAAAH
jgi:hypothetical protein